MTNTLKPAPLHQPWPSGMDRPIAVLPLSVHALGTRFGLCFEAGLDDLGPYHAAAIWLRPDQRAVLCRHDDYDDPGPTVWVDAGDDDVAAAQDRLLRVFGLEPIQAPWLANLANQSGSAHAST